MGKVDIGLKQAQRLAQLSPKARFAFLAEGLPHSGEFIQLLECSECA
ncbi:hypothetical protein [Aminobacter sp. Piv2-1]